MSYHPENIKNIYMLGIGGMRNTRRSKVLNILLTIRKY